ncbi:MAG: DUF2218 domain-containing protein [Pseudomonadota bacterium]
MPQTRTGYFPTALASKYLQQLCKHFAHKVDVRMEGERAEVAFPMGPAQLSAAPEGLHAVVSGATAEDAARAQGIIDSHLVRFAFREGFERMRWDD